jgi:HAD superfamily hydrolase (TIGR01509 family)
MNIEGNTIMHDIHFLYNRVKVDIKKLRDRTGLTGVSSKTCQVLKTIKLVKSALMTIKGLIFDFDGLVLDTETPEYMALNKVYGEYGQNLTMEMYGLVVGSDYDDRFEPASHLQRLIGKPLDRDSFWKKVNGYRMDLIEKTPLLPGVESYIREGKALGLKLAVASSSPHSWVDGHLKRLDLYRYFDAIKCSEDVVNIKPHPDLFLAALKALHLEPDEAVIFEDSANGVVAARQAGIRVVVVPNQITSHMNFEGETLRLRSMADFPLADLLRQL